MWINPPDLKIVSLNERHKGGGKFHKGSGARKARKYTNLVRRVSTTFSREEKERNYGIWNTEGRF